MSRLTNGDMKMAFNSLRSTQWRSLLTMLGVVIGVASVVTIVSIGEGIKHQVVGQVNRLGKDLITVRPGDVSSQTATGSLGAVNGFTAVGQVNPLTTHDLEVAKSVPHVQLAVPLSVVPGKVELNGRTFKNSVVIGTTNDIPAVLNQSLAYGDFFSGDEQGINAAVLGKGVANQMFPGDVPLGSNFNFDGQQFIVRGEFKQFDFVPLSLDADFNNAIFIPYSLAQQLGNGNAPIYEILVKPTNPKYTDNVVADLQANLLSAHKGVQDFSVLKQSENLAVSNSILNLLTSLISGIAAISLLVGGIGIMNIMLVSVTERTREIGVRKAIGATSRQILNQFLIEAAMLSLFGGVIGILFSLLVNVGLRVATDLQPVISWEVVGLAAAVSLVVGVVFGIVPALKAARKDPIDALRYQ